jgi:intracellular sulfur oxidation DsrE/DsrF family protein
VARETFMQQNTWKRRGVLSGLAAAVAALAAGTRQAAAQTMAAFQPARHAQDEWLDKMPGKHRVVVDVTSAAGVPEALRFVGNIFEGNKSGYGLEQADIAVVVVLRHSATAFGYGDALWAKHGKALTDISKYVGAAGAEPPKGNPFNAAPRSALDGLVTRGVQFMVCGTSSRGISRQLAGAGGDADAVFKEMSGTLIPSSRIVAAGVIGVTRAQEYGFSVLHVG